MTIMMINSVLSESPPLGFSVFSVAVAVGEEIEMVDDEAEYCMPSPSWAVTWNR